MYVWVYYRTLVCSIYSLIYHYANTMLSYPLI